MLVKLFYSLLLMGAGGAILKYRKIAKSWIGDFAFAEEYLGRGSSYFIIILIGISLVFLGITYLFGGIEIFPKSQTT